MFLGKKDTPYGYFVVDHKNKTVYKGGEFLSIKELLQFEDAATRFSKIGTTIDELLRDNPTLTTRDINRILFRQFGTRIHQGTVKWNDEAVNLRPDVQEQLRQNNRVAMGLPPTPVHIGRTPQPKSSDHSHSNSRGINPSDNGAGANDTNREWEISGMDMSVDDERSQRMKWRR